MDEKNFGFLGWSFQESLLKSIIEDRKYGERIIDVIESKYFDNNSFRFIMENIKELYKSYNKIPTYDTLIQKINSESGSLTSTKVHLDTLNKIKENNNDVEFVKERALNFCRQQNLKKELRLVDNILNSGDFESYNKIEGIIQKALSVGIEDEGYLDVFDNIDSALDENFREVIPTGVVGVDELLKGGLGRGELGLVLAPTGTGKTTLLTKISNTGFNRDFNVLQIFFEDNPGNIKRKHYTIWSGIRPDEQPMNATEVKLKVNEVKSFSKGNLKLLKLPSDSITITDIKNRIRKMASDGFKIDLLVIDYVDCITPEKTNLNEEWKGEGAIMRSLESMASEFDIAIWTATQGSRGSISAEIVTADLMGGSIKKAQIGHVILSIGKTLEQKEHNLATLTLVKSRIGKDGVVFQNCKFNNEMLEIDTDTVNTLLGHEEQRVANNTNRAREAYLRRQNLNNPE